MNFCEESYCGIECGKCEVLIATRNNELVELAEKRCTKAEALECYGCKSDKTTEWCAICEIKKCAKNKGIEFCYQECDSYPCDTLRSHTNVPIIAK